MRNIPVWEMSFLTSCYDNTTEALLSWTYFHYWENCLHFFTLKQLEIPSFQE